MFKIGDEVKVVRKDSKWICWLPSMNKTLGMKGIITDFDFYGYVGVILDNGATWSYRPESLELTNVNKLTQSDLQFLESELRFAIKCMQGNLKEEKDSACIVLERCDKSDKSTEYNFKRFSAHNAAYKYYKSKLKKLAALQAKIKRAKNSTF